MKFMYIVVNFFEFQDSRNTFMFKIKYLFIFNII